MPSLHAARYDFTDGCSFWDTIRAELASETSFSLHATCPEIALFRNIRTLSIDQWDSFNIETAELEGEGNIEEDPPPKKKRKIHSPRAYHYTIGDYESSTYYV
jgi:hypothetical protein